MAAPLLRHSQDSCLWLLRSRKTDQNIRKMSTSEKKINHLVLEELKGPPNITVNKQVTRFLSILRKCFAKANTSRNQDIAPLVSTTSGDDREAIKIPNKIARSPTAILEALAKTVRNDINKPLYQNVDDPALLSHSDGLTRHHLAALATGRKAAQTMVAMNPEYYTNFWDEPLPETFDTALTGYKHEDSSEEALLERIGKRKVKDSIQVYNSIKSQDGEISQPTLELFLDLLTVFNHEDPNDGDGISHYLFPELPRDSPFPASTWKDECLAEEIFRSLPEKSPKAYCSLINGMAENDDKGKAFELFNEARTAGVEVDLFTYNNLLSIASLGMATLDEIKQEIEFLLKDMAANNVTPDVETFNAALKNCTRISRWRGSKQYSLSILSEMKSCGIEPSLGTWSHILSIFYYHKDTTFKRPDIFMDVLKEMKDKVFELQKPTDVYFFRKAMKVITTHLPDSKLALELHDILKSHNNFDCMSHRQLRYAYFKELFLILSPVEDTDTIMDIYDRVVPYMFMPPQEVYEAIYENIETFDAYHYIPRIYADVDASAFFMYKGAVPLFHLMAQKKQEPILQQQFCDLSSAFLQRWKESQENRTSPYLDGKIIGDMIIIYLNGNQVENAQSALQMYRSNRKLRVTDPSDQSLEALANALIASNDFASTKDLLTLMNRLGCENIPLLVSKALQTFQLSDQERGHLVELSSQSSSSSDSSSDSNSDSSSDSD